mmetsp:Transcript_5543/g.15477  ORF Transcript_5543/g.15477 Transcript_5543/m.15477 type:complete len:233 (-) Transcript_5543:1318-2016(-)
MTTFMSFTSLGRHGTGPELTGSTVAGKNTHKHSKASQPAQRRLPCGPRTPASRCTEGGTQAHPGVGRKHCQTRAEYPGSRPLRRAYFRFAEKKSRELMLVGATLIRWVAIRQHLTPQSIHSAAEGTGSGSIEGGRSAAMPSPQDLKRSQELPAKEVGGGGTGGSGGPAAALGARGRAAAECMAVVTSVTCPVSKPLGVSDKPPPPLFLPLPPTLTSASSKDRSLHLTRLKGV